MNADLLRKNISMKKIHFVSKKLFVFREENLRESKPV